MNIYGVPNLNSTAFNCPYCHAFAHMERRVIARNISRSTDFALTTCSRCDEISCWHINAFTKDPEGNTYYDATLIYPDSSSAEPPSDDMPEGVEKDYMEAASIRQKSPRGSAALLRLALQKLCRELGEPGKNINDDIRALAEKKKVSQEVIHMADVLRITGNCSAHPGEMSNDDIDEVSDGLFVLINFIIKEAISDPSARSAIYNKMPERLRQIAESQDEKNKSNGKK